MMLNLGASCHQFCTLDSVRVLNPGCLLSPWLVYSGPKLLYLHLPILPLDLNLGYLLSPWLVYSGPKLLYLHLPILPLDLNLGYLLSPWLVYSGHKLHHFPILPLDLMYSPNSNTRFFLIFATSAQYALLAPSISCWRLVCSAIVSIMPLAPSLIQSSKFYRLLKLFQKYNGAVRLAICSKVKRIININPRYL